MDCGELDTKLVIKDYPILVGEILYLNIDKKNNIILKVDSKSCSHFPKGIKLLLCSSKFRSGVQNGKDAVIRVLSWCSKDRWLYSSYIDGIEISKIKEKRDTTRFLYFLPDETAEYRYSRRVNQFHSWKTVKKLNVLNSISPFLIHMEDVLGSDTTGYVLKVSSKRVNVTDAELMDVIKSCNVALSHSNDILTREILCTGNISEFMFVDSMVILSIHTEKLVNIWDGLDIYIFPLEIFIDESEETETMDRLEFRKKIGAWKYVGGIFRRYEEKIEYCWKSVYYTMLKFQPFFNDNGYIMDSMEEGLKMLLSPCPEFPGEIYVEVIKVDGNNNGSVYTISVIITGFSNRDVNMTLSRDTPYYLKPHSPEDDTQSFKTESEILEGYEFEDEIDFLCENIGEFELVQSTVKRWVIEPDDQFCCRVVLTDHRKTKFLQNLEGRHVRLRLVDSEEGEEVHGIILRTLGDVIIMSIKALCPPFTNFLISWKKRYQIRIDHEYETAIGEICRSSPEVADFHRMRDCVQSFGNDLKYLKSWKANNGKQLFAMFTTHSKQYDLIPDGTHLLLGKCWEVEGVIANKSDFLFAKKCDDGSDIKMGKRVTVCFEIQNVKNMVESENMFSLTHAYYFVEFIDFNIFRVFDKLKPIRISVPNSGKPIKHYFLEWKKSHQDSSIVESDVCSEECLYNSKEDYINNNNIEDDFCYRGMDYLPYREIGFVNLCDYEHLENGKTSKLYLCLNIEKRNGIGLCEDECDINFYMFWIGKRLAITLDHMSNWFYIRGVVTAVNGLNVTLLVDERYSIELAKYWINFILTCMLPNMMMLCYGENEGYFISS